VAVLSQGNGPKSVTPVLIEEAGDVGTITDKYFTIKRTGAGATDTSYTIRAGKAHGLNVEDYELFDLEKVTRNVPYAEQQAHYLDGEDAQVAADAAEASAAVASGSAGSDSEW
jgi:hypothetical protein